MQGIRTIGCVFTILFLAVSTVCGQQWTPSEKDNVSDLASGGSGRLDSDLRQRLQQLSAAENPATKPQAPPLPAAKSPTDREATNRSARSVVGVATNGTPRNAIVQTSFQQEETQTAPPEIKQTSAEERKQPAFLDLDSTDETHASAEASEPSDMDMILRLVTWTVIILCLCVLTVLGLRRWQRKNGMLPISQGNSRVLETVTIGPNRSVCLVQLRDVQAVVGCDASGIQSIVLAPASFEVAMGNGEWGIENEEERRNEVDLNLKSSISNLKS